MRVENFMTRRVGTVTPDTPILVAAKLMLENHISGLPVVDASAHVVGIVAAVKRVRVLIRNRPCRVSGKSGARLDDRHLACPALQRSAGCREVVRQSNRGTRGGPCRNHFGGSGPGADDGFAGVCREVEGAGRVGTEVGSCPRSGANAKVAWQEFRLLLCLSVEGLKDDHFYGTAQVQGGGSRGHS